MTLAVVVLSVVVLALLAVAGWLAIERGRLHARVGASERQAEQDAAALRQSRESIEEHLARIGEAERALSDARVEIATLSERLERQQEAFESARKSEEKREQELRDTFARLSNQALDASSKRLLQLATESFGKHREQAKAELDERRTAIEQIVKPIGETLKRTDEKLQQIEKQRAETNAGMLEQIRAMRDMGASLNEQTGKLVSALRKPQVRGRYGEIQLQRVVEIAGMREYCDFDTQSSSRGDDGRLLRPDMVVRLPNDRVIAIDAKTNIEPYLDAIEADDADEKERHLQRFARHVRDQATALAGKDYTSGLERSPEFVVMFIPGDQFVDAALQHEPSLLELAAQEGIIIASPATLIGLLRAVHVGWREKRLSDSAQELFALGRTLHERAAVALKHADDLGRAIELAVKRFNSFASSIDARLMPTLRRFEDAGAKSSKQLPHIDQIASAPGSITAAPADPLVESKAALPEQEQAGQ